MNPLLTLLEQDRLWVGFSGDPVAVERMDGSQASTRILWFQRRAFSLWCEARHRRMPDAMQHGVWEWFETRPLIAALRLQVRGRSAYLDRVVG